MCSCYIFYFFWRKSYKCLFLACPNDSSFSILKHISTGDLQPNQHPHMLSLLDLQLLWLIYSLQILFINWFIPFRYNITISLHSNLSGQVQKLSCSEILQQHLYPVWLDIIIFQLLQDIDNVSNFWYVAVLAASSKSSWRWADLFCLGRSDDCQDSTRFL